MSPTPRLAHPRHLTPDIHADVLAHLRKSLALLQSRPLRNSGVADIRVRDWWLIIQDGRGCLEVYLDKGPATVFAPLAPLPQELDSDVSADEATESALEEAGEFDESTDSYLDMDDGTDMEAMNGQGISLDECMEVHRHFLDSDALDAFEDDIAVQIGSAGMEPPLREKADFDAAVGYPVELKTWTKQNGRDKFVMILKEVKDVEGSPTAVLAEGPHAYEIPLSNCKFVKALPEHPLAFQSLAPPAVPSKAAPRSQRKSPTASGVSGVAGSSSARPSKSATGKGQNRAKGPRSKAPSKRR